MQAIVIVTILTTLEFKEFSQLAKLFGRKGGPKFASFVTRIGGIDLY